MTWAEIATKAREALAAILDGKAASFTINGRAFTALNLGELRQVIAEAELNAARETRGNVFAKGGFSGE